MNGNSVFFQYWPFFVPLILLQIGLAAAAFLHLRKHKNVRWGTPAIWTLLVLLVSIIGPVLYFAVGREDA